MLHTAWLLLIALCSLTTAQSVWDGEPCEVFAVRREGVVYLRIDTINTQKVVIPDEFVLTVDTIRGTEFIFNDEYIFATVNDGETDQVVIRKRNVDESTGLWIVPRPLRSQMIDSENAVGSDGEPINVAVMGMWDLRELLAERNSDNLALQGITDPFLDQIRYDQTGKVCHDAEASINCMSVAEELFSVLFATATEPAVDYFDSLKAAASPIINAGDEGYEGSVKTITLSPARKRSDAWMGYTLTNDKGFAPGEAGFRLADEEVEDVFWLEARHKLMHEVIPGVNIDIYGWRGGQVYDFVLENGRLVDGHIIVGPHPATDPWDMVSFGAKKYGPKGNYGDGQSISPDDLPNDDSPFSDLEVSSPGPALTFGYGRKTRIYVSNWIMEDGGIQLSWFGAKVPHDQDGASWPAVESMESRVFEFEVASTGTTIYSDVYGSFTGLFGGVLSSFSSETTEQWDRRYAVALFTWPDSLYTMNGESFPATVRRLGGWFRDRIDIISSYPAPDGSGDTIVQIADVPRPEVVESYYQPGIMSECPAYGGPILGRPGTGCLNDAVGHVHRGHQITSTTFSPGQWVTISGHSDRSAMGIEYTLNGDRLAIREGDAPDLLRIKKVGDGTNGGTGGQLSIWRLHKADAFMHPHWQNNGYGGSYMRFNYGEKIAISYMNAGAGTYPIDIHGHTHEVLAKDGEVLVAPKPRDIVAVSEAATYDTVVLADSPNHFEGWLHFAHSQFLSNPFTVWPNGSPKPGGVITLVDYTGFSQNKFAFNEWGQMTPFMMMPPSCSAVSSAGEGETLAWDILGWEYSPSNEWIYLMGEVVIPFDAFLQRDVVQVSQGVWSFTGFEGATTLGRTPIIEPVEDEDMPYAAQVRGFTEAGAYTFTFSVQAANVEMGFPVGCETSLTITVTDDMLNALDLLRTVTYGEPLDARLAGEAPDRGHISFQMFSGWTDPNPDQIDVQINIQPHTDDVSPLQDFNDGVSFFRWPVQNSHAHVWYSDWPYTGEWTSPDEAVMEDDSLSLPSFTLGRIGWDSRVTVASDMTYGAGVVNVDLFNNPTGPEDLANYVEVILPLYQGAIDGDDNGLWSYNFNEPQNMDYFVYFLITESSDEEFCEEFGCTYTPSLSTVPHKATQWAYSDTGFMHPSIIDPSRPEHVRERATSFLFSPFVPHDIPFGGEAVDLFPPGYAYDEGGPDFTIEEPSFDREDSFTGNYYSPLKRFMWTTSVDGTDVTREVVANMPFIFWENIANYAIYPALPSTDFVFDAQWSVFGFVPSFDLIPTGTVFDFFGPADFDARLTLYDLATEAIEDSASRIPVYEDCTTDLFRGAHPSQPWFSETGDEYGWDTSSQDFDDWEGPFGCTSDSPFTQHSGSPLTREISFEHMFVALKANKAHTSVEGRYAYYILTDASDVATAQINGINYAPRLALLGAAGADYPSVTSMKVPANGWPVTGRGPAGVHPALLPTTTDTVNGYSPFRHVTNLYWNCGNFDLPYGDFTDFNEYFTTVFEDLIDGNQETPYATENNIYGGGVQVEWMDSINWIVRDGYEPNCDSPFFVDPQNRDRCWSSMGVTGANGVWSIPTDTAAWYTANPDYVPGTAWFQSDSTGYNEIKVSEEGFVYFDEWAMLPLDNGADGARRLPYQPDTAGFSYTMSGGIIAGWWNDLKNSVGTLFQDSDIYWGVVGSDVGHRTLVVEYSFLSSEIAADDTDIAAAFQIQFTEENPNVVEVHYMLARSPENMLEDVEPVNGLADHDNYFSAGAQGRLGRSWANLFYGSGDLSPTDTELAAAVVESPEYYLHPLLTAIEDYHYYYDAVPGTALSLSLEEVIPSDRPGTIEILLNVGGGILNEDLTLKALWQASMWEVFPGVTAYPHYEVDDSNSRFYITFYKQFTVRYTFPTGGKDAYGSDAEDDVAQLLGHMTSAVCTGYVMEQLDGASQIWAGQEDPLVWAGVLIETEYATNWLKGENTVTLDAQPAIWNAPQVFTFDFARYHDEDNALMMSNDQIYDGQPFENDLSSADDPSDTDETYLFPGAWVVLWNDGHLSAWVYPEDDFLWILLDAPPVGDDVPVPKGNRYINPLAVVASRTVDFVTEDAWYNLPYYPPTTCDDVCVESADPLVYCSPCWSGNDKLYPDLLSDPSFPTVDSDPSETVWFVILEASDPVFADLVGAAYVPSLADADTRAVDTNVRFPWWVDVLGDPADGAFHLIDDLFGFSHLPGYVGHNNGRGPIADDLYSPIKRFTFNGYVVTINAPMVWWGADDGEMLVPGTASSPLYLEWDPLVSFTAPCSEEIRRNNASDIWLPDGPVGCEANGVVWDAYSPLMFHNGGQLLMLSPPGEEMAFDVPSVTVKLHRGAGHDSHQVPYYTIWDTTDFSLSGELGVPYVPRLRYLTRDGANNVRAFANGIADWSGGPMMAEPSILPSYADENDYSAFSHLTWLFYNCYERIAPSTSFIRVQANVGAGATPNDEAEPEDVQSIPGFNSYYAETFDPYQVRRQMKGFWCPDWVEENIGLENRLDFAIDQWIEDRLIFETESPAGNPMPNVDDYFAIVNMPQHLYIDLRQDPEAMVEEAGAEDGGRVFDFVALDDSFSWYWSVTEDGLTSDLVPVFDCMYPDADNKCLSDAQDYQGFYAIRDVTVKVAPGDRVNVWVKSSHTPHGLMFWVDQTLDEVLGMEAAALHRFFDIQWTATEWSKETVNSRFMPTDEGYWYGSSVTWTGVQQIFSGVVKPTALGSDMDAFRRFDSEVLFPGAASTPAKRSVAPEEKWRENRASLWFVDPAYGPAAMRVQLLAESGVPSGMVFTPPARPEIPGDETFYVPLSCDPGTYDNDGVCTACTSQANCLTDGTTCNGPFLTCAACDAGYSISNGWCRFGTCATYDLTTSFTASGGALPDLVPLTDDNGSAGLITSSGFVFGADQGLSLATAPSRYSIEMKFELDLVTDYRKLIDFKSLASDDGMYISDGEINFYPTGSGTIPVTAQETVIVTIVRDDVGEVTVLVNGVPDLTFTDTPGDAVPTELIFFQDDTTTDGESSPGVVEYIIICQ